MKNFNCIHLLLFSVIAILVYHTFWKYGDFDGFDNVTAMPLCYDTTGETQRIGILYKLQHPNTSMPVYGKFIGKDFEGNPQYTYLYFSNGKQIPICMSNEVRNDDIINVPNLLGKWRIHFFEYHYG